MQKSFNLACFIWNYARPSNPAKYLLRVREAGALGLPSAERRIPAMRPRLPAVGRISRCGGCCSGSAHVPLHCGQQVQPQAPTFPYPWDPSVNIYVVGSFPSKGSIFICPWSSFIAVLPERLLPTQVIPWRERREWLGERIGVTATVMTCEEHLYLPSPIPFSSG